MSPRSFSCFYIFFTTSKVITWIVFPVDRFLRPMSVDKRGKEFVQKSEMFACFDVLRPRKTKISNSGMFSWVLVSTGFKVIKLDFILRLKI